MKCNISDKLTNTRTKTEHIQTRNMIKFSNRFSWFSKSWHQWF